MFKLILNLGGNTLLALERYHIIVKLRDIVFGAFMSPCILVVFVNIFEVHTNYFTWFKIFLRLGSRWTAFVSFRQICESKG